MFLSGSSSVSAWYAFSVACAVSSVPHRASSSESEPSKGCHSAFAIPRAARSSAGAIGGAAAPPSERQELDDVDVGDVKFDRTIDE